MENKLFITAALCGNGTTREQSPYVPLSPREIADDVIRVARAGAAVAHLHFRDKDGRYTMEPDRVVEVVDTVRAAMAAEDVDIILNLTTSGGRFSEDTRLAHLPLTRPEMCSYDPGSMNWGNSYVFMNSPQFLERLGTLTQELGVKPELEIFDGGMLGNVEYYCKKGFLKAPLHYQFVLGASGGMPGTIESLSYLLPKIPAGSTWSITGIGRASMPCMLAGLAAGCNGLRVGLEDNVMLRKGVHATNAQLVEQAAALARAAGREIATAAETREILGIPARV